MQETIPAPGHPDRLTQALRNKLAERYGDPWCVEDDERDTPFGPVTKLVIGRRDGATMSWREVWDVFAAKYPDRWAIQVFPPARRMIDKVANYHLWVLSDPTLAEALCLRGFDRGQSNQPSKGGGS